jgi:subtilase family serine protease
VTLRDDLSGVGTFSFWWASKGKCTSNAPYVDCNLGRLAPGEEVVIEIRARVRAGVCEVTNRAIVDRFNRIVETNEANNSTSLTTPVGICDNE